MVTSFLMRARGATAGILVFSLISSALAPSFAATDEERSAARAAASQGADAFDAGKWQDAVDMLEAHFPYASIVDLTIEEDQDG